MIDVEEVDKSLVYEPLVYDSRGLLVSLASIEVPEEVFLRNGLNDSDIVRVAFLQHSTSILFQAKQTPNVVRF